MGCYDIPTSECGSVLAGNLRIYKVAAAERAVSTLLHRDSITLLGESRIRDKRWTYYFFDTISQTI